jgi:hypothetical protein
MAQIPFADRLSALGLDRFPEQDRADLERVVRSIDEAASRIRFACTYAEEPSNVFRLSPAAEAGPGGGEKP